MKTHKLTKREAFEKYKKRNSPGRMHRKKMVLFNPFIVYRKRVVKSFHSFNSDVECKDHFSMFDNAFFENYPKAIKIARSRLHENDEPCFLEGLHHEDIFTIL